VVLVNTHLLAAPLLDRHYHAQRHQAAPVVHLVALLRLRLEVQVDLAEVEVQGQSADHPEPEIVALPSPVVPLVHPD
jgi:hypothetical protein